ncbi:hypothetical protein CMV_013207 [Castanea mollissima]|uniref:Uncharacterized protein n=1 Tax=Castanea mollissima TaxID=60419 RepID=A0A8J4VV74_9ROSI|nr:hypothetical protein CMV_013207 [Castanea mollissima]
MLNFVFESFQNVLHLCVNFNEQCEMFLGTGYGSVHSMQVSGEITNRKRIRVMKNREPGEIILLQRTETMTTQNSVRSLALYIEVYLG